MPQGVHHNMRQYSPAGGLDFRNKSAYPHFFFYFFFIYEI